MRKGSLVTLTETEVSDVGAELRFSRVAAAVCQPPALAGELEFHREA